MNTSLIAIVDDDLDILDMTSLLLALEGYQTICEPSGVAAAGIVNQQQPALVIVDLHIDQPESGLGLVEHLLDDPATASIPVVIWSADPAVETKVKRRGARAVPTLTKPVMAADLLALVRSYVQDSRG